jgi:iron complex outermembrane receptor protein
MTPTHRGGRTLKTPLAVLPLAAALALGLAHAAAAQDEDEVELEALLELMTEETEIATKTKQNADFVPGIVTVLDAEKLRLLGVRTVWEAMPYIPGVQASLDPSGQPTVTVRGIPFPFNAGNIAILVDGVAIERESAGLNGAALYLPIEQVERIEFVRGPGSVVYGDFAFMGLLNVVTARDDSAVELYADNHDAHGGNARFSHVADAWAFSVNAAPLRSDDAIAQQTVRAEDERLFWHAGLTIGEFTFGAHAVDRNVDDVDGAGIDASFDETSRSFDAHWNHAFGETLELKVRAQRLSNEIATFSNRFEGDQNEYGADLLWTGWARQSWLVGLERVDGEIDRALFQRPALPGRPPPPAVPIGRRPREVNSVYAQNQVEVNERLFVTLGARYDDVSETGSRVTPRAAVVWRFADRHIVKAQYAEGFRSPTFFELYPNDTSVRDLDFEVNRTLELNYVYQRPNLTARATVFRSRIDDMVFAIGPSFGNVAEASADGVELEWSQQLTPTLRADANLSWVDAEHTRNPTLVNVDIAASANWLANLGVLWTPGPRWAVGAHWNHVGTRETLADDADYDQVDFTVTRRDLFAEGFDVSLGVNNALNDRTVHVLPLPNVDIPLPFRDKVTWLRIGFRW